jgi:vibriolysin
MQFRRFMPLAWVFSMPLAACSTSDVDQQQQQSPSFAAGSASSAQLAEQRSMQYLFEGDRALLHGVDEVWTRQVRIDKLGEAHTRVLQTVDNIPVFGGEAIVHLNKDGSYKAMTDNFKRDIAVDTTAKYSDFEAVDFAVDLVGGWSRVTGTPRVDMQILRRDGGDYLTYRVQLAQFEPGVDAAMPVMFIDAKTGELVWKYNNLKTAKNRKTYTANNGTSTPGTLVRSEGSGPSGDAVLDAAHDNAGLTYDYYFSNHGRDSFDDAGATLTSTVHYSNSYVNAYWDGSQMVYGDGDGVQSDPLTVTDVVGHELTHAVTDYSSDLIYSYESGALNEAMSDIFGAAIEAYRDGAVSANTWLVGEECWTPGTPGDALRYMHDPAIAGDYDYYPDRYTGSSDNGGVHWNSGIANLAFYLMVEGGTHPRGKTSNTVPALDAGDAISSLNKGAAIFYRANTGI